jgi:hypothetical protein
MSGSVVPAGLLMIERVPSISAISSHNIINSDCVVIAPFSIPTRLQFFQPLVLFNDYMFLPQIHTKKFAISLTVHRQLCGFTHSARRDGKMFYSRFLQTAALYAGGGEFDGLHPMYLRMQAIRFRFTRT